MKHAIVLKGIPTLGISDYPKAVEFYVDFLGFSIDWEHRFGPDEPVYMQISRNGLLLHLSENKRFRTGNIVFVETRGIEALHREWKARRPNGEIPEVSKTKWQTLQMELEDPFGNLLRFNENISES